MASPSEFGRAGIGIRDCTLPGRELRLASALALATSAVLAGVGTTGDMTGITTASPSTTTATFPTAESSSIVTTSIAAADFMAEAPEDLPVESTGSHHIPDLVRIPAHSAALIMEESREAFLPEDNPASAEDSTEEVAFTEEAFTEEAVAGNSVRSGQTQFRIWRKKSCARKII